MSVTQTEFRTALLDSALPAPKGLRGALDDPAGRRFNVYRNNVAVSLTEALETGFPVIAKLLGEENFKAIAGVYLRQSPPETPLMMQYGRSFPAFLRSFEPLVHLGYLGDVAELELALRRSYHAEDAEAIGPNVIAAIPQEKLGDLRLKLTPSTEVLTSDWPVYGIWAFNMLEGSPKPQAEAQDVLITRVNYDPEPHLLPPGGFVFLQALRSGDMLGDAAAKAAEAHEGFDLGATLALLLNGQAITSATY